MQHADLVNVDWTAVVTQVPSMLVLVALIVVIMNIAGLGGGTVESLIVPASLRSKLFGAATCLTGVAAALVIGCAIFLGDGMLELVPVSLVEGILFFAGLGMLDEGLVRSRRRLPWSEYGIIVLIFVVIIAFGLFEGVGVGMLATLVFFAVRLSRVDHIESRFTGRERRSTESRPVPDRAILLEEGERVVAYRLRGYIFFGSAGPLADHLKKSLGGASRPACLMLDFSAVSGFDFSALRVETNADRAPEVGEEIVIAAWRTDAAAADGRRAALCAGRRSAIADIGAGFRPWGSGHAFPSVRTRRCDLAGPSFGRESALRDR